MLNLDDFGIGYNTPFGIHHASVNENNDITIFFRNREGAILYCFNSNSNSEIVSFTRNVYSEETGQIYLSSTENFKYYTKQKIFIQEYCGSESEIFTQELERNIDFNMALRNLFIFLRNGYARHSQKLPREEAERFKNNLQPLFAEFISQEEMAYLIENFSTEPVLMQRAELRALYARENAARGR